MSNRLPTPPPPPVVEPNQKIGEYNAPEPHNVIQYSDAEVEQAHTRAANALGIPELSLWLQSITKHPEYPLYMEYRGQQWGRGNVPTREKLLTSLVPSFSDLCQRLLSRVKIQGFDMVHFFTWRSVYTQSRLWAQSQTVEYLAHNVRDIHFHGAPYIAAVLANHAEYCMTGKPVTSALPGLSWHQWGLAMDCYVVESQQARWSITHPGYRAYATVARDELGLTAGFFWNSPKDGPHVQYPSLSSPRRGNTLDWRTIDICMWSIDQAVQADG